jgi:hypothetical protein
MGTTYVQHNFLFGAVVLSVVFGPCHNFCSAWKEKLSKTLLSADISAIHLMQANVIVFALVPCMACLFCLLGLHHI